MLRCRHIVTSVLYYVHRYLRLTIPYGLVMGVCIAVLPFLSYGPSWSSIEGNAQVTVPSVISFPFFLLPLHLPKSKRYK